MKYFGVTLDINNPHRNLSFMGLYGYFKEKEIDLFQLAAIELLDVMFDFLDPNEYERIVLFSLDELEDWDELRELTNTCDKYNLEYTFIREDIHSDKELKIGELTGVI